MDGSRSTTRPARRSALTAESRSKREREDEGPSGDQNPPKVAKVKCLLRNLEFIHNSRQGLHIDPNSPQASTICTKMQSRYNKITSIGRYEADDPMSYCYVDDCDEALPSEAHYPITYGQPDEEDEEGYSQVIPHEYKNAWKSLAPESYKEELLIMLTAFRTLERTLEYRYDTGKWHEKFDPVSLDDANIERFRGPNLVAYGDPDPSGKTFVELLLGNTSSESLRKNLESSHHSFREISDRLEKFLDFWSNALLKQMTNGAARAALNDTFDFISKLMRFVPESMAPTHCLPLVVWHITSPTPSDSFSISDCGHKAVTRSLSRSRNSSTSRNENEDEKDKTKEKTGSNSVRHSRKQSSESKPKRNSFGLPNHSRSYVDLAVICADRKKEEGKYILLVETYSHGKTYSAAIGKFKKELVHVLQGQTEVFGLFISSNGFEMFRAVRNIKDERIYIWSSSHNLHSQFLNQLEQRLNVKSCQTLVMHVFTCFVYGMSCIEI